MKAKKLSDNDNDPSSRESNSCTIGEVVEKISEYKDILMFFILSIHLFHTYCRFFGLIKWLIQLINRALVHFTSFK